MTHVGSHDTASAVVGVPAGGPRFAYVACGTWSLVGVELDAPVLSEESRAANFTNEAGVDGRIRYLRNVMGLWLLQESLRTWERAGQPERAATVARRPRRRCRPAARSSTPTRPASCRRATCRAGSRTPASGRGRRRPTTRAAIVRCILDSLAAAYARAVDDAVRLSGDRRRRRPPRRRRRAERAALPADRRRLRAAGDRRPGRGDRDRQRPRPGPRPRARERRPRGAPGARPGDPPPATVRAGLAANAAAWRARRLTAGPARCASPCSSPASTTCCSRTSARRRSRCCGAWATRSSSRRPRPAAARCTSTPATATPASRSSGGSPRRSPGSTRS